MTKVTCWYLAANSKELINRKSKLLVIIVIVVATIGFIDVAYNARNGVSTSYVYKSDINQSDACAVLNAPNSDVSNSSFSNLLTNVEEYPKFVALEGNRTGYSYSGASCGGPASNSSNMQLTLNFLYVDMAHSFQGVCPGEIDHPQYYINVEIDLLITGYDLYHSIYSQEYFGPTNMTAYGCTIDTTTG